MLGFSDDTGIELRHRDGKFSCVKRLLLVQLTESEFAYCGKNENILHKYNISRKHYSACRMDTITAQIYDTESSFELIFSRKKKGGKKPAVSLPTKEYEEKRVSHPTEAVWAKGERLTRAVSHPTGESLYKTNAG